MWRPSVGQLRARWSVQDGIVSRGRSVWLVWRLAVRGRMVGIRISHHDVKENKPCGEPREQRPAPWEGGGEWLNVDACLAKEAKFERCRAGASGGTE